MILSPVAAKALVATTCLSEYLKKKLTQDRTDGSTKSRFLRLSTMFNLDLATMFSKIQKKKISAFTIINFEKLFQNQKLVTLMFFFTVEDYTSYTVS